MSVVRSLFAMFLIFVSTSLFAQQVEMADTMRSEGKIYVVVAILVLILCGLLTYLVMLDKKVTRLEKRLPKKD